MDILWEKKQLSEKGHHAAKMGLWKKDQSEAIFRSKNILDVTNYYK